MAGAAKREAACPRSDAEAVGSWKSLDVTNPAKRVAAWARTANGSTSAVEEFKFLLESIPAKRVAAWDRNKT